MTVDARSALARSAPTEIAPARMVDVRRFDNSAGSSGTVLPPEWSERAVVIGLLVLAAVIFAALKWLLVRDAMHSWFVAFYGGLVTVYLASRFFVGHRFVGRYEPLPDLPSLAVIVPVKNEGLLIGMTVQRLFAAGYPADRFEVVVVDDGSTDETSTVLRLAQEVYPQLKVVTLPENVGKRRAMAAGVHVTSNDVVVVIDSDTMIETGSLVRLVQPFGDLRVAGVSGRTKILNEDVSWLTRVQSLVYEVSFRIHKSAEAAIGSVTCCPGCFSAYRRQYIEPLMDEWSNQLFLGKHTIFGDDRALTMLLLREGYKVTYEATAMAATEAPLHLRGYLRQQLRWKKSWVQQGLRGCGFMWRRSPLAAFWFYTGFGLSLLGPHVLLRTLVLGPIFDGHVPWRFLAGSASVGLGLACYLCIQRRDAKPLRAVLTYPFVGLLLTLQMPFALGRLADGRWGTR